MSLVDCAERCTVGALLLAPGSADAIGRWLLPADFAHPRNAIGYQLVLELAGTGRLGPTELLSAALRRADARRNRVDGPYIHDLLRSPGSAGRPDVYGRMVLDAAVRRAVTIEGLRLHRVARSADVAGLTWALAEFDRAVRTLGALSGRLALAGVPRTEPARGLVGSAARTGPGRAAAQERAALAALLACPASVPAVERWLEAEDFGSAVHAATYAAIRELSARGEPVEPLTVAWLGRGGPAVLSMLDLAVLALTELARPAPTAPG